jgi:hypothetical protein
MKKKKRRPPYDVQLKGSKVIRKSHYNGISFGTISLIGIEIYLNRFLVSWEDFCLSLCQFIIVGYIFQNILCQMFLKQTFLIWIVVEK